MNYKDEKTTKDLIIRSQRLIEECKQLKQDFQIARLEELEQIETLKELEAIYKELFGGLKECLERKK